jgi:shikimate 5-dehydrogenase
VLPLFTDLSLSPCRHIQALPVLFDVNYWPKEGSPIVQQFRAISGAVVLTGSDMVTAQGLAQFERWTSRAAPEVLWRLSVVRSSLLTVFCLRVQEVMAEAVQSALNAASATNS